MSEKGKNEFHFTLPTIKKEITFKFLTHGDESKIKSEVEGVGAIIQRSVKATITDKLKEKAEEKAENSENSSKAAE